MTPPNSPAASFERPAIELDDLTRLFRALSDPVRVRILLLLLKGERNVTSLCTMTELAQPTVSHHLGLLRTAALVEGSRRGKAIYYNAGPRVRAEGAGAIVLQAGDSTGPEVLVRLGSPAAARSSADRGGKGRG
jgi:ArsR family transcriptional regulator